MLMRSNTGFNEDLTNTFSGAELPKGEMTKQLLTCSPMSHTGILLARGFGTKKLSRRSKRLDTVFQNWCFI